MFWPRANPDVPHAPAARAARGVSHSDQLGQVERDPSPRHSSDRPEIRRAPDPICDAVGGYCLKRATYLIGLSRGQQKSLGACLLNGQPLLWDYWWPHLGLAADRTPRPTDETAAKVEWAEAHAVLYCSPDVNRSEGERRLDLALLADLAAQRRGH